MDQNNSSITLADVLRLFKGKLKKIVCIAIVVGVLAACVGVAISYSDDNYSGTVHLYLAPGDTSHLVLNLISSDKFAEVLLLDEYGLPPKAECNEEDYNAAIEAAKEFYAARQAKIALARENELFAYSFALVEQHYNSLNEEYIRIAELVAIYKSTPNESASMDPGHVEATKKYEAQLDAAAEARNEYRINVRDVEVQKRLDLEKRIAEANRALKDARERYEQLSEKVLAKWRETPEVKTMARAMSDAISCEYVKNLSSDDIDKIKNDELLVDSTNVNLIKISVSSSAGKEFVADVLDRIKAKASDYVELNIEKAQKVSEAECSVLSTFASPTSNADSSLVKNAVIYGAIGFIGYFVLHSVVVVIVGLLPPDLQPQKKSKKAKNNKKETESAA